LSTSHDLIMNDWDFLIGYPLEKAKTLLMEEGEEFTLKTTSAPGKQFNLDEAHVVAVRQGELLEIICACPDWTVGGTDGQK